MILVKEIHPLKISGLSSLLISFDYNENIVSMMKTLPTFYYHKKLQAWEIPLTSLSVVLDMLTGLDSIRLELLPDSKQDVFVPLSQDEIDAFSFKPFKHQLKGIDFMLEKKKSLLLDGMGVGKTVQLIGLAETLKRRGLIDHCLIICGVASLRQNWKREITKFSTESVRILGEKVSKKGRISYASLAERAKELHDPIQEFFVVTNIESIRSDKLVEALQKSANSFGMIAVDEIHKIATKTSAQGTNLLKIKSDWQVGATGTLITNSPISCYVPLSWTGNDSSTLTMFKSQYCKLGGFHDSQIIGYQNLELLKEEIDSCSIRRTLNDLDVDVPPKRVDFELVELEDEHRKFYEAIKEGVKEEADKIELNASNLLALTTRLRQATACPAILSSQDIMSTKLDRCVDMVEELVEQGEKVVVMSNFIEPVNQLAKLLVKYAPLVCTGEIPDDRINFNVEKFQNDPNSKVILATHSKMGTGHTLNAAMYMICLDTPFTYSSFAQSCDRIWRVNNTRPAYITVLVAADTIDQRVQEIVEHKKDLSDYLVDGQENEISMSMKDELLSIVRGL